MRVDAPVEIRTVWTERRRRASELAERYPHAAPQLALYAALLEVQEPAFHTALDHNPVAAELPGYVAEHVLPGVVDCSVVHGPPVLAEAALDRWRRVDAAEMVGAWLRCEEVESALRCRAATSVHLVMRDQD